jgi:hypothetical protein
VAFLPTINSCVGVFWPFTISGWCSISYPADMVFRLLARVAPHIPSSPSLDPQDGNPGSPRYPYHAATRAAAAAMADARRGLVATAAAARARVKAAVATAGFEGAGSISSGSSSSSKKKKKKGGGRRRRGSVERVGISISCRYNPSTGFFVRVTPWIFILPGLQLLARLLARLFNFVMGRVEELESRAQQSRRRPEAAVLEQEEKEKLQLQLQQQQQQQQLLVASASARRFKVRVLAGLGRLCVCPFRALGQHA